MGQAGAETRTLDKEERGIGKEGGGGGKEREGYIRIEKNERRE